MRLIPALIATGSALALCTLPGCSRSRAGKTALAPALNPKDGLHGTVQEILPAPPYTYLRLATAQGEVWAAVLAADVKVGATVTVQVQVRMDKFTSPSLKRVFDVLYMGTLAGGAPANAMAPAPLAPQDERVDKAPGAEGRTVAELFARRKDLKARTVTVKGKVVKYNAAILGRNWLHLRDGSGSAGGKDNDICVTSQDPAKVGDVVTARGVLHLDRDFGSGYTYPVIVEDARLLR